MKRRRRRRMMEEAKFAQLPRQLKGMEFFMAVGGLYKSLNTVQAVWLTTPEAPRREDVLQVLRNLTKRMPQLETCLQRRFYQLWLKKMPVFQIDFEISSDDVLKVFLELLKQPFDMFVGPLWRVRLVVLDSARSVLIFCIHHCITDGTTNMFLCREVVNGLNSLYSNEELSGVPYNMYPCLASQLSKSETNLLYQIKYFVKRLWRTVIEDFSNVTSFNGVLDVPHSVVSRMEIIFDELDEDCTKLLLSKCKENGVTVNSCVLACMYLSCFHLSKHRRESMPFSRIHSVNCVDCRRFYPEGLKDVLGCHFSIEEQNLVISQSDFEHFWCLAQKVQEMLHRHVHDDRMPLKLTRIFEFASLIFATNYYMRHFGFSHRTDCHFMTSNMGDLKDVLSTRDGPVQMTSLLRSINASLTQHPCILNFHTFRNKLMFSLDYCTSRMSSTVAQTFFSDIIRFSKEIALKGGISLQKDDLIV